MSVVIRNIDTVEHIYSGQTIAPGASYTVQTSERSKWASNDSLIIDITDGKAQVNDGTADIPGAASQIAFLLGQDVASKDSEGAFLNRTKITQTGWSYQLFCWEMETAKLSGLLAKDYTGTDIPYFTYKMYDVNGQETQTEANCVKTVVDFEPQFDYEIVGGYALQKTQPTSDLYYHCVAVPDIPEVYGGNKIFIRNVNLSFVPSGKGLDCDGRAPKKLTYSAVLHTNKIRFIMNHPAGFQHRILQAIEIFKP